MPQRMGTFHASTNTYPVFEMLRSEYWMIEEVQQGRNNKDIYLSWSDLTDICNPVHFRITI